MKKEKIKKRLISEPRNTGIINIEVTNEKICIYYNNNDVFCAYLWSNNSGNEYIKVVNENDISGNKEYYNYNDLYKYGLISRAEFEHEKKKENDK
jgi:hypothetical protein